LQCLGNAVHAANSSHADGGLLSPIRSEPPRRLLGWLGSSSACHDIVTLRLIDMIDSSAKSGIARQILTPQGQM
jgi:hypothetical protein